MKKLTKTASQPPPQAKNAFWQQSATSRTRCTTS